MSKKTLVAVGVIVSGATISLALLRAAAAPQDGARPAARGAEPPPGGGPPGGPPPGFGPGMFLAPAILDIADENADGRLSPDEAAKAAAKFMREADSEKRGSLDAAALGRAINRQLGPPPGGGPGGPPDGPGGGGPPRGGGPGGGFGPGTFLAPRIVEAADANQDKRLSPDEAAKAVERLVREMDTKKTGSLDEATLAAMINQRMGPPPGFGPGGPMGQERKLVKQFDRDADGRLDKAERQAAREFLKKDRQAGGGRGRGGFGPPPGFGDEEESTPKPGRHLDPAGVPAVAGKALYDPSVLRALFLEFDDKDWESQLTDFYHTDVEVPATLIVDNKRYPNVGVHCRGMSSFMGVREGHKRSLNISLDFVNPEQRLYGYKTLNLLNSHEDPTFMHTVLYLQIAASTSPLPKPTSYGWPSTARAGGFM